MNKHIHHVVISYFLNTFPVFLLAQSVLVKLNSRQLLEYLIFSLISRSLGTLRNLFSSAVLHL